LQQAGYAALTVAARAAVAGLRCACVPDPTRNRVAKDQRRACITITELAITLVGRGRGAGFRPSPRDCCGHRQALLPMASTLARVLRLARRVHLKVPSRCADDRRRRLCKAVSPETVYRRPGSFRGACAAALDAALDSNTPKHLRPCAATEVRRKRARVSG